MLLAVIRSIGAKWTLLVVYLSGAWARLLGFSGAGISGSHAPKPDDAPTVGAQDANEVEPEATGPVATTFLLDHRGFPKTTPEQDDEVINAFIESIDSEAVCALASRHNHEQPCRVVHRSNGSFNVCFFVEFDNNGPKWIVRAPIIPSLHKPWQKLLSEVATLQFLQEKTRIPVPHILAYGRDAVLTKTSSQKQLFLIQDFVPGEALNKKDLLEAPEEHRRDFYSQLIDILADLRSLEFPLIGSLMPNPDGSPEPIVGPVLSMTANRFRQHLPTFSSMRDYLARQFLIIEEQFRSPVPDMSVSDVQNEVFVLYHLEDILYQAIDPDLDRGPFILNHLDLRCPNIIVDKNLHIQGIIDWEFSSTVPRQLFTPPSWITAHDSIKTKKEMHIEFRQVLDEKSNIDSRYDQLRREWYHHPQLDATGIDHPDLAFCIAHLIRRPDDTIYTFCDYFAPKLYNRPIEDITSEFFKENKACAREVQRREEQNRLYTQYLKDNDLYVQSWQEKWLAESNAFMAELEAKDLKKKLEGEKAQQYQNIKEVEPSLAT
ncbi:phosphotransferase enzyme family protein [Metarhizium acridum CQMa 102]|uniref:Phosphotransferase enzyme family protein n=1 Tax=Metarhizium acridum (strain CQMa 102) TaxID=655827 RepID=E9E2I8_METAQ|nr:phosphotransferase enzyme family protein [Metarhizium acridum CQMa 102]EFY89877.1 phosphotransferase enzyme family protein [Metarhizium acridum CQMa 102]